MSNINNQGNPIVARIQTTVEQIIQKLGHKLSYKYHSISDGYNTVDCSCHHTWQISHRHWNNIPPSDQDIISPDEHSWVNDVLDNIYIMLDRDYYLHNEQGDYLKWVQTNYGPHHKNLYSENHQLISIVTTDACWYITYINPAL